ncbi:MAG: DUF502 domain-containing protein [Candidatus Margulisbacteria bacterium]|nr:DUF502 domain-containing protein [Candidatus Margulisiibacteriota bacterium]
MNMLKKKMTRLRNYFFTGLFVILPTIVTIWIVVFIFKLFGAPVGKFLNVLFFAKGLDKASEVILGFLIAVSLISLIGYLANITFLKRIANSIEEYLHKIPLINMIYPAVKKMIKAITTDNKTFQRVVLIEYPRKGLYSLCFVTKEVFPNVLNESENEKRLVSVFVPTTPNPTSGFILLVPRNEIKSVDISVEDGIKMIVSAGFVSPDEV